MSKFYLPSLVLILTLFLTACPKDDGPAPPSEVSSATKLNENPRNGYLVDIFRAPKAADTLNVTYKLTSQDPDGAFALSSSTGKLTVADSTLFDYEARKVMTVNAESSRSSTVITKFKLTIQLQDVKE